MIRLVQPQFEAEEIAAVTQVLRSGQIAQGNVVSTFEEAFAQYCGSRYAVAVSSGTAALHLSLLAHGIGPGDEVITTPFTFIATVNAILYVGATPVFADIDPETFTISPKEIEKKITNKTKAILSVHLYGCPADMVAIMQIAKRHRCVVIEDACQAHGAMIQGKKVGTFGTGCFSFYATKNMSTGEGGMVTTNNESLAIRVRLLRQHGMKLRYHHEILGYNFRLTDLQAAIGCVQLKKLEKFTACRIANAASLSQGLSSIVPCPATRDGVRQVFHQYTIRVKKREQICKNLQRVGIETGVYYPLPVYKQPALDFLHIHPKHYPQTEQACSEVLSLPVHPFLSTEDIIQIITGVQQCFV